jgi:hypothetical protein
MFPVCFVSALCLLAACGAATQRDIEDHAAALDEMPAPIIALIVEDKALREQLASDLAGRYSVMTFANVRDHRLKESAGRARAFFLVLASNPRRDVPDVMEDFHHWQVAAPVYVALPMPGELAVIAARAGATAIVTPKLTAAQIDSTLKASTRSRR